MKNEKLNKLIEILSIPTYFGMENLIMSYLINHGLDKEYIVNIDDKGNVYFTKGNVNENEYYPCVCAHTDTVFSEHQYLINKKLNKIIKNDNGRLTAINPLTKKQTGIGGDDLAGCFICLEMMEHFDNIKAVFFVEEEFGCNGSQNCDDDFFDNVGYVIQFDGPTNNWYTNTLSGVNMFDKKFDDKVSPILEKYKIDNYSEDPYTDILILKEKFDFCCCNLPSGYYNWHSNKEYVDINAVENGIEIGIEFITKLGLEKQYYNN